MEIPKKNTSIIGELGEKVGAEYLKRKGYIVLETNYWCTSGEIDIIARKDDIVHFVEVKTASYESKDELMYAVTHETWQPEELVHRFKMRHIVNALETWISDSAYKGEWFIDVAAIRIVPRETYAMVKYIEHILPG